MAEESEEAAVYIVRVESIRELSLWAVVVGGR
jgi:hypothetical protein